MFAAVFVINLLSCSPLVKAPVSADIESVNRKGMQCDLSELHEGYTLFINKCSGCHLLHQPMEYSDDHWKKLLPEMAQKAKLSEAQTDKILKYILAKSTEPKQ